jgi:hypothetical protein
LRAERPPRELLDLVGIAIDRAPDFFLSFTLRKKFRNPKNGKASAAAVGTTFDGFPMAQAGRQGRAARHVRH